MKAVSLFLVLCVGVLFFGSCGEGIAPTGGEILPKIDTFDCPPPKYRLDGSPENHPAKSHKLQRVSIDGAEIAYVVNENISKNNQCKNWSCRNLRPQKYDGLECLF